MSAATDKARFFLEQSVPELKEYERKKIFNKVWAFCSKKAERRRMGSLTM